MEKIRINACTTNMNKFKELSAILGDQFELVQRPIELTETQGKPREIVERKAKEAYAMLNEPLFVEDVSLFFNAFNGLPGPYVKDFLTSMGPQGMYRMLADFEDKSATALCSICFIDGNTLETFEGRAEGTIVEPRGSSRFGWDGIFEHKQMGKTYAEMTVEEKNSISNRSKAANKLKEFLVKYYTKV